MQPYQPHKITRNRVIVGLVLSTMLAACAAPAVKIDDKQPTPPVSQLPKPVPAPNLAQTKADNLVNAAKAGQEEIRFTDLESCKVETERLYAKYNTEKEAFDAGQSTGEAPIEPTLKPDDCEAFLVAAEQEYAAQAPTYADQQSCEVDETECERIDPSPTNNYVQPIYRPVFYGSYGYNPWLPVVLIGGRRYYGQHTTFINTGSSRNNSTGSGGYSSNSQPTTSKTTTPKTTTPKTTTPKTTTSKTTTTPKTTTSTTTSKPASTKSGSNGITGRGSSGFGSSYTYTGKGGK